MNLFDEIDEQEKSTKKTTSNNFNLFEDLDNQEVEQPKQEQDFEIQASPDYTQLAKEKAVNQPIQTNQEIGKDDYLLHDTTAQSGDRLTKQNYTPKTVDRSKYDILLDDSVAEPLWQKYQSTSGAKIDEKGNYVTQKTPEGFIAEQTGFKMSPLSKIVDVYDQSMQNTGFAQRVRHFAGKPTGILSALGNLGIEKILGDKESAENYSKILTEKTDTFLKDMFTTTDFGKTGFEQVQKQKLVGALKDNAIEQIKNDEELQNFALEKYLSKKPLTKVEQVALVHNESFATMQMQRYEKGEQLSDFEKKSIENHPTFFKQFVDVFWSLLNDPDSAEEFTTTMGVDAPAMALMGAGAEKTLHTFANLNDKIGTINQLRRTKELGEIKRGLQASNSARANELLKQTQKAIDIEHNKLKKSLMAKNNLVELGKETLVEAGTEGVLDLGRSGKTRDLNEGDYGQAVGMGVLTELGFNAPIAGLKGDLTKVQRGVKNTKSNRAELEKSLYKTSEENALRNQDLENLDIKAVEQDYLDLKKAQKQANRKEIGEQIIDTRKGNKTFDDTKVKLGEAGVVKLSENELKEFYGDDMANELMQNTVQDKDGKYLLKQKGRYDRGTGVISLTEYADEGTFKEEHAHHIQTRLMGEVNEKDPLVSSYRKFNEQIKQTVRNQSPNAKDEAHQSATDEIIAKKFVRDILLDGGEKARNMFGEANSSLDQVNIPDDIARGLKQLYRGYKKMPLEQVTKTVTVQKIKEVEKEVEKIVEKIVQVEASPKIYNDKEGAKIEPNFETKIKGNGGEAVNTNGKREKYRFAVVEADDINSSFNPEDFNQPRDRNTLASQVQIDEIAKNPLFEHLSINSTDLKSGAPVLTNDGHILAGNGRMAGLSKAYNQGTGASYKEKLIEQGHLYGIDKNAVEGLNKPVLVRVLDKRTPEQYRDIAIQSNQAETQGYNDQETARLDAERVKHFEDYDYHAELGNARNKAFLDRFFKDIPTTEMATLLDKDGSLTQKGYNRVGKAVLYKAFGDNKIANDLINNESTDLKNLSKALIQSAPILSNIKTSETLNTDIDLSESLLEASKNVLESRKKNTDLQDILSQSDVFTGEQAQFVVELSKTLDSMIKSPNKIKDLVETLSKKWTEKDTKGQELLFADIDNKTDEKKALDMLREARDEVNGQGSLFQLEPIGKGDLVATHGLDEDNLRMILKNGGIPVPSIAIHKKTLPNKYGNNKITLIAKKDLVENEWATSQDGYTVRHPEEEFRPTKAQKSKLEELITNSDFYDYRYDDGVLYEISQSTKTSKRRLKSDLKVLSPIIAQFLISKGKKPKKLYENKAQKSPLNSILPLKTKKDIDMIELVRGSYEIRNYFNEAKQNGVQNTEVEQTDDIRKFKEYAITRNDYPEIITQIFGTKEEKAKLDESNKFPDDIILEYIRKIANGNKVELGKVFDYIKTRELLRDILRRNEKLNKEFDTWVNDKIDEIGMQGYVEGTKDAYYLENITRWMIAQNKTGAEKTLVHGFGKTLAQSSKDMKGLEDFRKNQEKLLENEGQLEQFEADRERISKEFREEALNYKSSYKYPDSWDFLDDVHALLGDVAKQKSNSATNKDLTDSRISQLARNHDFRTVTSSFAEMLNKYADELIGLKSRYFEAKPSRFVKISEFDSAVIPKGTSKDVKDGLKQAGIKTFQYGEEGNAQALEKAQKRPNVLFQLESFKPADTNSKEFKKWFGKSKVVDEDGEPLKVYHGTRRKFNTFEPNRTFYDLSNNQMDAMYFTSNKREAEQYAINDGEDYPDDKSRVIEVYLKIENDSDGIIRKSNYSGDTEYIVFDPKNIKSAKENTGEFSESNPDIRYSLESLKFEKDKQRPKKPRLWLKKYDGEKGFQQSFDDLDKYDKDLDKWLSDKQNLPILTFANKKDKMAKVITKSLGKDKEIGDWRTTTFKRGWNGKSHEWRPLGHTIYQDKKKAVKDIGEQYQYTDEMLFQLESIKESDIPAEQGRVQDFLDRVQTAIGDSKAYQEFASRIIDQYDPLKRFERKMGVLTKNDDEIDPKISAYGMEALSHGRATAQMEFAEDKYLNPILDLMKKYNFSLDDVGNYLYSKHAPERNRAMEEINPSRELISSVLDDFEGNKSQIENKPWYDELKDELEAVSKADSPAKMQYLSNFRTQEQIDAGLSGMSDKRAQEIQSKYSKTEKEMMEKINSVVKDLNNRTLVTLVKGGLISKKEAQQYKAKYENYMPLQGFADETVAEAMRVPKGATTKGLKIAGKDVKDAHGRETEAFNPLATSFAMYSSAVARAERNMIAQKFGENVESFMANNPDQNMFEFYEPEVEQTKRKGIRWLKKKPSPKMDTFSYKVKGETKHIIIKDQALKKAMMSLDTVQLNKAFRSLNAITRTYGAMLTSWNPEFIIPNMVRDLQSGFANTIAQKDLKTAVKMVKDNFGGSLKALLQDNPTDPKFSKYLNEFNKVGARTGYIASMDAEAYAKNLAKKLDPKIPQGVTKSFERLGKIGDAVENSTRLAYYITLREMGVSAEKAGYGAKNLTVNFNRKGSWGQVLNTLYLFMNATIQGNMRFAQLLKTKRGNAVLGGIMATGFVYGLVANAMAPEDEAGGNELEKKSDWEREHNILALVPEALGGSGEGLKIPLAYGYNIPFNIGQFMADKAMGKGNSTSEMAMKTFAMAFSNFSPLQGTEPLNAITPTFAKPFYEQFTNQNFAGQRITNTSLPWETRPESQLGSSKSTPFANAIAKGLNSATGGSENISGGIDINPDILDHYYNWATGGTGKFLSKTMQLPFELMKEDGPEARNLPIMSRFITTDYKDRARSQAWEDSREMHQILEAGESSKEFRDNNREQFNEAQKFVQLEKYLQRVRKQAGPDKAKEIGRQKWNEFYKRKSEK